MADDMTGFRLYAAWVQCGEAPPYQLTPIPVRMTDGYAEIQLDGQWMPCPGAGDKPKLKTFRGQPLVGIATDWRLA